MKKLLLSITLFSVIASSAQTYEYWGVSQQGGTNGRGTIYKTDSAGHNVQVLHNFLNGDKPAGSLFQASNGKLYGTTAFGGTNDLGTLFTFDPITSTFTNIVDLDATTGTGPRGSFMQASNGLLYTTTFEGGQYGRGTVIELDPSNDSFNVRHDFGSTSNHPRNPFAGQLIENNGKLYGNSRRGGIYNDGTIYSFDLTSYSVTKLHDLSDATEGSEPFNSLFEASNGIFYGMTFKGGPTDDGVIFAYDPVADTFAVQEYFINTNGIGTNPQGSLVEAQDGKLYGFTSAGGTLFSFDMSTTDVTMVKTIGDVRGNILIASNGHLYGSTYIGQKFEYNVALDTFDYRSSSGVYSLYGRMIEVEASTVSSVSEQSDIDITIFPNPAKEVLNIKSNSNVLKTSILSMDGKIVARLNSNTIDVSQLPKGIYTVVVTTKNGTSTRKLIKE